MTAMLCHFVLLWGVDHIASWGKETNHSLKHTQAQPSLPTHKRSITVPCRCSAPHKALRSLIVQRLACGYDEWQHVTKGQVVLGQQANVRERIVLIKRCLGGGKLDPQVHACATQHMPYGVELVAAYTGAERLVRWETQRANGAEDIRFFKPDSHTDSAHNNREHLPTQKLKAIVKVTNPLVSRTESRSGRVLRAINSDLPIRVMFSTP